jgi:PPK2 family polyphosphate:nucleotide phosphotransferase
MGGRQRDTPVAGDKEAPMGKGKSSKGRRAPEAEPSSVRELLRVDPSTFRLAGTDPRAVLTGPKDKETALAEVLALAGEVADLQERLFAETKTGGQRRVVVLLQGMDTAGKGGAAKLIDRLIDPAGLELTAFKAPTEEERHQHYLQRIEKRLPGPGVVAVWDRSHYEDVLVVRVRNLVPPEIWGGRYDEINSWEAWLTGQGFTLVKVMLNISKEEQRQRFLARLDDPTKHWKYRPGDLDDREAWDEFMEAYQVALTRCSTPHSPWYVIPADRKWHRDWLLAQLMREVLTDLDPQYPPTTFDVAAERARVVSMA